ncbi:hypothetical protein ACEZCY_32485 [Streptacidiphilus sp. N1-12]|uniref:Gram-positive cocci surface proteins LPxTG domain-containing protein n=2 Tax=Streptacidiphilus alkalitolerans TaxID=3342712 RepID=A0ABV6XA72_9ACTN
MSTRARTRVIAVASVLLTAAITGGTALLPTAAHAVEPRHTQAAVQAETHPPVTGDGDTDDTAALAGGALAFTATGVVLAIGIRRRSRQQQ